MDDVMQVANFQQAYTQYQGTQVSSQSEAFNNLALYCTLKILFALKLLGKCFTCRLLRLRVCNCIGKYPHS